MNRARRSPSRSYIRHARSPSRTRSPRLVADTWVPSTSRTYDRLRSRSPPALRRRSRSPSFYNRDIGQAPYRRARSPPRRFSPRRDERPRSPRQALWRSRSPYSEGRSRDTSWGRTTPIRPRESSPPSQDFRYLKRERFTSSDIYPRADSSPRRGIIRDYGSRPPRARSPIQTSRERHQEGTSRRRSISPSRDISSIRYSVSGVNHKRMSPLTDRTVLAPFDAQHISHGQPSRSDHSTPNLERTFPVRYKSPNPNEVHHRPPTEERSAGKEQNQDAYDMLRATTTQPHMSPVHVNHAHVSSNIPTQPKAHSASMNQMPPSGPSHGPKSLSTHSRGPNISLLSAPTRPRGSSNLRDNPWAGAPPRRVVTSTVAQGPPPSGPRGTNLTPTGTESLQHTFHRQNSITNGSYHRTQRLTNHLSGLCSIIPGGKVFPLSFELSTEKRLSQLDIDKEKLFDQVMQKQKSKRSGIRDWDRLDRESSISTLKSELAEGHLHRITGGESVHIGTGF